MDITLLCFEDCPNWRVADERLATLAAERSDITVTRHLVETVEESRRVRFHGSPSILVNGVDVFAEAGAGVGLSCRRYLTPEGPAGSGEFINIIGLAMKLRLTTRQLKSITAAYPTVGTDLGSML